MCSYSLVLFLTRFTCMYLKYVKMTHQYSPFGYLVTKYKLISVLISQLILTIMRYVFIKCIKLFINSHNSYDYI